MMKLHILLFLFGLIAHSSAQSENWREQDAEIEKQQIKLWEGKLTDSFHLEGQEKVKLLSLGLRNMGYRKRNLGHNPQVDRVYQEIQSVLIAIPGHAEYYGERISRALAERRAVIADVNAYSIKSTAFRNEQDYGLQTLAHLPSRETVKVLGEFLADEWVSPALIHDKWTERSMAAHAVGTLARLPIVNKPTKENFSHHSGSAPDLPTWQAWHERIKSGDQTFRFEGDPVEYDLNGPASKEKLVRIERDRKRDAERVAGERRSTPAGDEIISELWKPTTMLSIVAACVALLTAGVYWMKLWKAA